MYIGDNFSKEEKYKLFRNMYEVIHPTISKRNISSYRIVLDEEILPVRVYYPKKLANINSCIVFIPGDGRINDCFSKYDNIISEIAIKSDKLVIAIDYFDEDIKYPYLLDSCYETVKFLFNELVRNGIDYNSIYFMGDSFGGNLVSAITLRRKYNHEINGYKEVLFYPILSGQYFGTTKFESLNNIDDKSKKQLELFSKYFKKYISNKKRLTDKYVCPIKERDFKEYPDTLIFTGEFDILRDEDECFYDKISKCCNAYHKNIVFCNHGFLGLDDSEIKREVFNELLNFMEIK